MSLLEWRNALRQDREALKGFTCTYEGQKARHGRPPDWILRNAKPYERVVQSLIRARINPPCRRPPCRALLGWEGDDLGAVVHYSELDGAANVMIDAIAVSIHLRSRGGAWAREAMTVALDEITYAAIDEELPAVLVTADIHERNSPSQTLFREERFAVTRTLPDGYQRWQLTMIVSED